MDVDPTQHSLEVRDPICTIVGHREKKLGGEAGWAGRIYADGFFGCWFSAPIVLVKLYQASRGSGYAYNVAM